MSPIPDMGRVASVAVIGGGPAGAATALSLRKLAPAWPVTLLHTPLNGGWRPGETLAPGCRALLESLALWQPFLAENFLEAPGTRAAWGGPEVYENEFLFSARGPGWHLDRPRFDRMLIECARAAGVETIAESWRTPAGEKAVARADFVVDATGRPASFATSRGARRVADDALIGVCSVLTYPHGDAPQDRSTLIEAGEHGWWYSAIVPGGRVVAAWMSDADLVRAQAPWSANLAAAPLTRARIGDAVPQLAPAVFSARSQRLLPCAAPGWLAVGDAAAAFDPLSSQGIVRALRLGKIASFTVYDFLRGRAGALEKYRHYIAAEYEHYGESKARFYRLEARWPAAPFWARRHSGNQPISTSNENDHGSHDKEQVRAV